MADITGDNSPNIITGTTFDDTLTGLGGDDKINCAGAPEAHDRALEYLLSAASG